MFPVGRWVGPVEEDAGRRCGIHRVDSRARTPTYGSSMAGSFTGNGTVTSSSEVMLRAAADLRARRSPGNRGHRDTCRSAVVAVHVRVESANCSATALGRRFEQVDERLVGPDIEDERVVRVVRRPFRTGVRNGSTRPWAPAVYAPSKPKVTSNDGRARLARALMANPGAMTATPFSGDRAVHDVALVVRPPHASEAPFARRGAPVLVIVTVEAAGLSMRFSHGLRA